MNTHKFEAGISISHMEITVFFFFEKLITITLTNQDNV